MYPVNQLPVPPPLLQQKAAVLSQGTQPQPLGSWQPPQRLDALTVSSIALIVLIQPHSGKQLRNMPDVQTVIPARPNHRIPALYRP